MKLLAVNHTDNSSLLCTKGECHIQTLVSENFGPLNAYYDVNNVSISAWLFILQTIISRWQNQQNYSVTNPASIGKWKENVSYFWRGRNNDVKKIYLVEVLTVDLIWSSLEIVFEFSFICNRLIGLKQSSIKSSGRLMRQLLNSIIR